MISIRQTLFDLVSILFKRPLALFWSIVVGLMASLSGGILLGTGMAALQRYLYAGIKGEKGYRFDWSGTFSVTHIALSLIYLLVSFFTLLVFIGTPSVVILLVNTMVSLYFLYVFLLAEPNMRASQVFQQNFQLIRKGDLWKHVALIFLWAFLQYLVGNRIEQPELPTDLTQMSTTQAQALLDYFTRLGFFSWVSFVVASIVSASWYHQLTSKAEPESKDKIPSA